MTTRAEYYYRRHRRLRRSGLCTRCGAEPPVKRHALCAACLEVMAIKKPGKAKIKDRKHRESALLRRLEMIKSAEVRLKAKLEKVA